MAKIEAVFRVDDDVDPEMYDPMSVIDEIILDDGVIELVSAEWVEVEH